MFFVVHARGQHAIDLYQQVCFRIRPACLEQLFFNTGDYGTRTISNRKPF